MERRIEFLVKNQKVAGILHLPKKNPPFPGVICSHGYKSNKDSKKYTQIGYQFSENGIAVLRFDHRGLSKGENGEELDDSILTSRIEDDYGAIDFLKNIKEIDSGRLGLIGSSFGGLDVLLVKNPSIRAKVVMATPFVFPKPSEEMLKSFSEKGYYQNPDGSKTKKEFYDNFQKHDLKRAVNETNCPILIIHGDSDEQVSSHQAKILYEATGSKIKEMKIIKGGDHSFINLDKLNEVALLSLEWFKKYL